MRRWGGYVRRDGVTARFGNDRQACQRIFRGSTRTRYESRCSADNSAGYATSGIDSKTFLASPTDVAVASSNASLSRFANGGDFFTAGSARRAVLFRRTRQRRISDGHAHLSIRDRAILFSDCAWCAGYVEYSGLAGAIATGRSRTGRDSRFVGRLHRTAARCVRLCVAACTTRLLRLFPG